MIWDKQSFVFLDSAVAQQGVPPAVPDPATEPYPLLPLEGRAGARAVAFLPSPGIATAKKTKILSWWSLPCPSVFIPVLFLVCFFTFLFKLLF